MFYVGQLSCVVDIGSVVFMIVSSVPWRFSSVFLSRIILFSPLGGTRFSVGHKGPATEGTFIFEFTVYLGAGFAYARFIFDCVID